jgi:deferrochelatase/peroxidase EfeB
VAAVHEAADIQAIVDRGFGSLAGATYLLIRVREKTAARAWLRTLPVTSLADARAKRLDSVVQLAFTASGLDALGFDPVEVGGFAPEFLEGMAGNERKSCQLGDQGINSPEYWTWGVGPNEPHILVMLLAPLAEIAELEDRYVAALPAAGCALILANRSNGVLGHEPFGFADGLSQPEPDWEGKLRPGTKQDRVYRNRIAAGEFLLGHPNEYGFVADYPPDEIGRNGSYLVYRQLAQDVRGFWQCLASRAGSNGAIRLAEMMVGRGMNGDPLPMLKIGPKNDFTYLGDPDGACCPIGAHIRRANPRSGDDPNGHHGFLRDIISSLGLKGTAIHDAVASARFHRLLRRGRSYGPVIEAPQAIAQEQPQNEEEAGLHFICLNASLARQFEFVQGAWVASAYFGGLSCEQDPVLGNRIPDNGARATNSFNYVDETGCPRIVSDLAPFVRVRGGAYFFLPGLKGLEAIIAR